MITDTYLKLNEYQHSMENLKAQLQQAITSEHLESLTSSIKTTSQTHTKKRKTKLQTKLNPRIKELREHEWVVNMSSYLLHYPLSTAEHNIQQKGINYNTDAANQLEFSAAVEGAFKAIGLPTETQENIRQTIIL